jgi:hypothetical protein
MDASTSYSSQGFDYSTPTAYPSISFPSEHSQQPLYDQGYAPPPPPFLRQNSSSYSNGSGSDSSGEAFRAQQGYSHQPQYTSHPVHSQQQQPHSGQYDLPPSASMPSNSAAMLLQQHQANQQAFRSSQTVTSQVFQANNGAQNDMAVGGSDGGTRESSASSGGGTVQQEQNGDGDFTQTFYDPFRCVSSSSLPFVPVDLELIFLCPLRIKHRRRTSPPQLKVLEYHFEINPKPDVTLRKALSEQLDMTPREVQVWVRRLVLFLLFSA